MSGLVCTGIQKTIRTGCGWTEHGHLIPTGTGIHQEVQKDGFDTVIRVMTNNIYQACIVKLLFNMYYDLNY